MDNNKKVQSSKQDVLEFWIIAYQDAVTNKNNFEKERLFHRITEIYQPKDYMHKWHTKYGHLYDDYDDFKQDYMNIFIKTLNSWKPRDERAASRYGGKGYFQNFFFGALSHSYINKIKSEAAVKRNVSQSCPICKTWHSPLSTHVLKEHADILWNYMKECGYDINEITRCPFCKSHKNIKREQFDTHEEWHKAANSTVRKHILSLHSGVLFEKFHEIYPEAVTISSKTASIYQNDEENGEEVCGYDSIEVSNKMDVLNGLNLSDLQRRIIRIAIEHKHNGVMEYNSSMECTEDEFNDAMQGIKDAMSIAGWN
jgi:hypothetical protein